MTVSPRSVACVASTLLAALASPMLAQDTFEPVDPARVSVVEAEREYTGVGRLEFNQTTIDLGEVDNNGAVTAEFRFTNAGDGPVEIERVRASCGCTTTALPKMRFEPGESEVIRATIKPRRPGLNSSSVTVTFKEPQLQPMRLRVSVDYAAPFKLSEPAVRLGNVELGTETSGELTVLSRQDNLEIVSVTNPGGLIELDWQADASDTAEADADAEVAPASSDGSYPFSSAIGYTLKDDLPTGQLREAVIIRVKERGTENVTTLTAYVIGIVLGDLTTKPAHARLQPSESDPGTYSARVEVVSRADRPFTVSDVRVIGQSSAEFTARILPNEMVEGDGTWVEVVATPTIEAGVFRATLEIYSDRGTAPLTAVCVGIVRAQQAAAQ
ncbi:MAG: DUF1573 domain-containing protein [Planctomycetota bacterium]